MTDCQHPDFNASVYIHRLTDIDGPESKLTGFQADVRIECKECALPFAFLGVPMGLNLDGAAASIDGHELRVAIAPSLDWVAPGKASAPRGFSVSFTRGNEKGGNQ